MTASNRKCAVGLVGLGIMGGAFARHLLESGFIVVGYDVRRQALAALRRSGGRAAQSPAEVAARASIVITSLPSVKAFEAAMSGRDGIAAGCRRGAIVIETSTLPILVKERGRKQLAASEGLLLDCPISGTGAQAATKDVVVYASGPRTAVARCAGVFRGFARGFHYCGAFGAGSKLKFVANLLVTIHNLATAEAMVLGEKAGMDLRVLQRIIADGAGTSRIFEMRGPLMARCRYDPPTMRIDVHRKDIDIIREYARRLRCPTPLFNASLPYYTKALRQGRAKQDTAAIHAVLRREARLSGKPGSGGRAT